jgi:hypothetical protein
MSDQGEEGCEQLKRVKELEGGVSVYIYDGRDMG